jgi:hypothetical protein
MEITLSTSGTSESLSVLKYGWTIKDYIRELAAGCYFVRVL